MGNLVSIRIDKLVLSRFNSRKTRPKENVERLAKRIKQNGFEATRALWVYWEIDKYEVFAGGTRLEAARLAGLTEVPCLVHDELTEEEIARLETADNENDEYHAPVPLVDVWAECWRLNREEKWTQARIAEAKGWDVPTVSRRCKWHESLPKEARKATCDGLFDEGHLEGVSSVTCDVASLAPWLTTPQAQSELVAEVLSKHLGVTKGIKPSVAVVREAAKRWKGFIEAAESALNAFDQAADRKAFVAELVQSKARSLPAVEGCKATVLGVIAKRKADAQRRAQAESDEAAKAAALAERQQALVARCVLGDARELILQCPEGATLMLTDPPYGVANKSGRVVVGPPRRGIAGDDDLKTALALLAAVVERALPRMAEDAHLLVFTGWRFEPEFRVCLAALGLTLKGSLVWVKNNHGIGDLKGTFAPKHERILHFVKGKPELARRIPDVLGGRDIQNSDHPTEKPEELLRELITACTNKGELVLDPFAGSGSTLFAAHATERAFWGAELEVEWHTKIAERLFRIAGAEEAA